MASNPVREPAVAGTFYPDDPDTLRSEVTRLLKETQCKLEPERHLKAVACPHAAYKFSGAVAAEAFSCLQNRNISTVVLVGPDHYVGFEGIALYADGAFRTPLGDVHVDVELATMLLEEGQGVVAAPEAHAREHALEVQLPFLQTVLPRAAIVPILMGFRSRTNVEMLATLLSRALDRPDVVLVASTDLSHYHPRDVARKLDGRIRDLVQAFAPTALWEDLREGRVEACGGDPLVSVMLAAGIAGAESSRILRYGDSGDASGDASHVVGYLSAAFYRGSPQTAVEFVAYERQISPVEADSLLCMAYESAMRGEDEPPPLMEMKGFTDLLRAPTGAFVTLRHGSELRGCIGFVRPDRPLWEAVSLAARGAARHDSRFRPVTREEMPEITIEISILSRPREVTSPGEVIAGRHGVIVTQGSRHGLLLPQVAEEYGWTREQLLDHTCEKAGLPRDAWRKGATIEVFEARILEREPRPPAVNGGK